MVDNIPFVATMIPLIESMAPDFGGSEQLMPIWWSLALGSCLGGNGSLIGASANLIVAGFAERAGQPIRFLPFSFASRTSRSSDTECCSSKSNSTSLSVMTEMSAAPVNTSPISVR